MKTRVTFLSALLALAACTQNESEAPSLSFSYPQSVKIDYVDNYRGVDVADPYRWLEGDVRENASVRNWVDAQNVVTFAYLESIPERKVIKARLTQLWDYEKFGIPVKEGGRYFYSYNDGLQNQDLVYMQDSLDAEPRVLIDPNTWSDDGTIALAAYFPAPDGKHLAYLVQDGGSDWRTGRVMDIASGKVLDEQLDWLKFTELSWRKDGSGFYYSRYPSTQTADKFQSLNLNQALYFHRLGAPQESDEPVFTRADHPEWGYHSAVTDEGRYLVITIWKGTDDRYQIAYKDLEVPDSNPVTLIEGFDFDYTLIGAAGTELFFRTNNNAPRNRLIAVDVNQPQPENWREIVPQAAEVLSDASLVGGKIIGEYMKDAWSVVKLFNLDGNLQGRVQLPGIGAASGFGGKADDAETFFAYGSFNVPTTISRLDVSTGEIQLLKKPEVAFDPDEFVVKQVFYGSKDGTRVPMFIAHKSGMKLNGNNPTLLYGYGGFNISVSPGFSVSRLAWMEMGGIYAVANLRGGGEYGEEWHQAGTKLNKQNVFDDFIAAAEYLVNERYTKSSKLAIFGGSNGGLLVGAVVNQRPALFAAAIPAVGVMDMLRFHEFTAGRFWVDDYGSSADPEQFKALLAYSPYHNIRPGTKYPAVMVTTADTDDRVVPGHSFKYTAALQAAQAGDAPVLIRIETRAGHGAGVATEKVIEEYADRWAFLYRNLDMKLPEGYGKSP